MSQDNMELAKWGDGTIRLAFWDRRHGEDRIFELCPNGRSLEDGKDIDLVKQLRNICMLFERG